LNIKIQHIEFPKTKNDKNVEILGLNVDFSGVFPGGRGLHKEIIFYTRASLM
jgi:hypothetical protein